MLAKIEDLKKKFYKVHVDDSNINLNHEWSISIFTKSPILQQNFIIFIQAKR